MMFSFSEGIHTVLGVGVLRHSGDMGRGCMSELAHGTQVEQHCCIRAQGYLGPAGGWEGGWEAPS